MMYLFCSPQNVSGWKADKGIPYLPDQGWTHFCCWCLLGQCRLPGSCNPPGHQIKTDRKFIKINKMCCIHITVRKSSFQCERLGGVLVFQSSAHFSLNSCIQSAFKLGSINIIEFSCKNHSGFFCPFKKKRKQKKF